MRTLKFLKGLRFTGKAAQGNVSSHLRQDSVNSLPLPDDLDSEPGSVLCCAAKQRKRARCACGSLVVPTAVSLVLDLSGFLLPLSQAAV